MLRAFSFPCVPSAACGLLLTLWRLMQYFFVSISLSVSLSLSLSVSLSVSVSLPLSPSLSPAPFRSRSLTYASGEPLLRVFRELMQRVNVDDDDSSSLSSLRLTLNLDDVPPTEEALPTATDMDGFVGRLPSSEALHGKGYSPGAQGADAQFQRLQRLELLLRSIRDPSVNKLVRVAADYEPQGAGSSLQVTRRVKIVFLK